MRGFHPPPLDHCEFHGSQFQARVEAQPIGSEGFGEALVLEEKVKLFVLVIHPCVPTEVCSLFEPLML